MDPFTQRLYEDVSPQKHLQSRAAPFSDVSVAAMWGMDPPERFGEPAQRSGIEPSSLTSGTDEVERSREMSNLQGRAVGQTGMSSVDCAKDSSSVIHDCGGEHSRGRTVLSESQVRHIYLHQPRLSGLGHSPRPRSSKSRSLALRYGVS